MRPTWLLALYPSRWRARYGEEFRALLEAEDATPAQIVDIVRGALVAHASPQPAGGLGMHRSRMPAVASVLAVLLVLPALTFVAAAAARLMQPAAYQPARTANAIFDAFAGLPNGWFLILLGAAPSVAVLSALFVIWRRLASDQEARDDLAALVGGLRRIERQPALIAAAFALVASVLVLTLALVHAIAG